MNAHLPARALTLLASVAAAFLLAPVGLAWGTTSSPGKPTPSPSVTTTKGAKGTVTFSVQPANDKGPDGRQSYEYHKMVPGTVITDFVAVTNLSKVPFTFSLSGADGEINADGSLSFSDTGQPSTDFGSWVTVGKSKIKVPPHSRITEPFTVAIPTNAKPGDHTGGIITTATVKGSSNGNSVEVNHRIALPVHLDVPGQITSGFSITGLNTKYHSTINPFGGGGADVSYTITNSGNINLGGKQHVSITGPFGVTLAKVDAPQLPVLLPGKSFEQKIHVPGVFPLGWMSTKVVVTPTLPGTNERTGVKVTALSKHAGFFATPVALIVGIILVVGAVFFGRRWMRVRRNYREDQLFAAVEHGRQEAAAQMAGAGSSEGAGDSAADVS